MQTLLRVIESLQQSAKASGADRPQVATHQQRLARRPRLPRPRDARAPKPRHGRGDEGHAAEPPQPVPRAPRARTPNRGGGGRDGKGVRPRTSPWPCSGRSRFIASPGLPSATSQGGCPQSPGGHRGPERGTPSLPGPTLTRPEAAIPKPPSGQARPWNESWMDRRPVQVPAAPPHPPLGQQELRQPPKPMTAAEPRGGWS